MRGYTELLRVPVAVQLAANLWPLYGAWYLGWGVYELIVLYWLENVVIGVFNLLKMATLHSSGLGATVGKFFMIPFFTVHYGMFTAIHGMFVIMMFGPKEEGKGAGGPFDVLAQSGILQVEGMQVALLLLLVSHLVAYFYDYIRSGEYRHSSLQTLMHAPYKRVVVLHLTIIFGGFLVMALHEPLWALAVMISIKLIGDIIASKKRRTHGEGRSDSDADVHGQVRQSR